MVKIDLLLSPNDVPSDNVGCSLIVELLLDKDCACMGGRNLNTSEERLSGDRVCESVADLHIFGRQLLGVTQINSQRPKEQKFARKDS